MLCYFFAMMVISQGYYAIRFIGSATQHNNIIGRERNVYFITTVIPIYISREACSACVIRNKTCITQNMYYNIRYAGVYRMEQCCNLGNKRWIAFDIILLDVKIVTTTQLYRKHNICNAHVSHFHPSRGRVTRVCFRLMSSCMHMGVCVCLR